MNAKDVKRIRAKLKLSQSQFAGLLGVSVRTLQQWEQDRQAPGAPSVALLKLAGSGLLTKDHNMDSIFSLRSLERSAKRIPDEAIKQARLAEIAALREANAELRKVRALVRELKTTCRTKAKQ